MILKGIAFPAAASKPYKTRDLCARSWMSRARWHLLCMQLHRSCRVTNSGQLVHTVLRPNSLQVYVVMCA